MRVGVALCTYNGQRYIQEQLDSIASQTRLPDVLVIHDDGSSDNTVEIARQFASLAPFPVEVRVNPVNLGPVQNFEQALLELESGMCEVLLPCDQDDWWHPNKVAEQAGHIEDGAMLSVSDTELMDEVGNPLGVHGFERRNVSVAERALHDRLDFIRFRIDLGAKAMPLRAMSVLLALTRGRYHRYASGVLSAARDVLVRG